MINLHHLVVVKLSLTVTVELISLIVTISKNNQHFTSCYYLMYYLICLPNVFYVTYLICFIRQLLVPPSAEKQKQGGWVAGVLYLN